jgi:hypothetical protein
VDSSLIPNNVLNKKMLGQSRPALGLFASLSNRVITRYPDVADNLNLQAQSTFRTVSLLQPDTEVVTAMILKAEGYTTYKRLAEMTGKFVEKLRQRKFDELYGQNASAAELEAHADRIVTHDLQVAVRFSKLLRD